MISLLTYKLVHILGLALVMTALGAMSLHAANGGTRESNGARKLVGALHGIGMFLILLGGFGMLARLGIMHGGSFPGWIWAKLTIWVLAGAAAAIPARRPALARPMLVVVPLLAAIAAYLGLYKPI